MRAQRRQSGVRCRATGSCWARSLNYHSRFVLRASLPKLGQLSSSGVQTKLHDCWARDSKRVALDFCSCFSLLAFKHPAQYAEYRYCALVPWEHIAFALRSWLFNIQRKTAYAYCTLTNCALYWQFAAAESNQASQCGTHQPDCSRYWCG